MKKFITTPIYYINDVPHIGHAYTTIAVDVLTRFYRQKGDNVFFLTGVDEHGAKIAEAAKKAGENPQDFVDKLVPKFQKTWTNLNISYSEFLRTTNPDHEKVVSDFVKKIKEKGFIEKRKYEGLYCVGCEKFLAEEDLIDGKCPDHQTIPQKQSEENYFFLLSKFQEPLKEAIESGKMQIVPEARKNEILGKLNQGLEDVSISRANVSWGIPFPEDEKQTIYVWVDALLNYYSATKIYGEKSPAWPADLHLMAKDILWFHAVIWPAMLMALDLDLPRKIFAHGFFTVGGKKMSKTLGNILDPNKLVEKFGADAVRYALLREFPFGEDGDISEEKISLHYSDLANNIGNLLQRTIVMINQYGIKPKSKNQNPNENQNPKTKIDKLIEILEFYEALIEIMKLAEDSNKFIAEKEPWKLEKEEKRGEQEEVLNIAYHNLEILAEILEPFMPETSEKMKTQLETLKPEPLFPKLN